MFPEVRLFIWLLILYGILPFFKLTSLIDRNRPNLLKIFPRCRRQNCSRPRIVPVESFSSTSVGDGRLVHGDGQVYNSKPSENVQ